MDVFVSQQDAECQRDNSQKDAGPSQDFSQYQDRQDKPHVLLVLSVNS
jgi:hypothetical protein